METVNAFMRIIAAVLCFISVPQVEMVPINYAPFNTTAMTAVNDAGASIEIFWFNPYSEELINQTPHPIRIGTEKLFNCYEGHEFVARFQDHIEGVETKWVKLHREERVIITYDPDENKMHSQQLTIVDKVKDMINTAKSECGTEKGTALAPCVNSYLMKEMNVWQTLKENTKKSRDGMAGRLASYICNDPDVEPTKPIDFNSRLRIGRREYIVDYYLDLPESKIYVIDGFITQKQCDHLSSHMTPYDDAVVVSQDGAAESTASGDEISRPRRYWYDVDGVYPSNSAKMPFLWRATYLTLGSISELNSSSNGQELLDIHVYGKGAYHEPHCPGVCTGEPYKTGARAATVIMHCKEPASGGTLSFPKADVILKPTMGSAVFISYKDSAGHTDEGYTEHMSCPVREGEKVTAVLHLREGVTAERPWSFFSPTGVPIDQSSSSSTE